MSAQAGDIVYAVWRIRVRLGKEVMRELVAISATQSQAEADGRLRTGPQELYEVTEWTIS